MVFVWRKPRGREALSKRHAGLKRRWGRAWTITIDDLDP